MSQISVVNPEKLYSIHRFLSISGRENFTSEDTKEIAKVIIQSLMPEADDETDELLLALIYDLMSYASSDGYHEGLSVGLCVAKHLKGGK